MGKAQESMVSMVSINTREAWAHTKLAQFAKDNYIVHNQLFDRIKDLVYAGVASKED